MTTTTKTKPSKTEALAAERSALLAAATALRESRLKERDLAIERVDEISQAWKRGDSTFTSADSLAANEEHRRMESLLAASVQQVKHATRRLVNVNSDLAETIAPALRLAYDVDQQIETIEQVDISDTRPLLTILQAKPGTTSLQSGSLSGEIELIYRRGSIHAPLAAERIEKHLADAGHTTRNGSGGVSTSLEGVEYVDRTTVKVLAAYPPIPAVDAPGTVAAHVKEVGDRIAYDVAGLFVQHNPYGKPSYPVKVEPHAAKHVSTVVTDGVSRTTVRLALDFPGDDLGAAAVDSRTRAVLEGLVGSPFAGLGRWASSIAQGSRLLYSESGVLFGRSLVIEVVFESSPVAA